MKYIILALFLTSASAHADGFYLEIGAYAGSTDYTIKTDERVCVNHGKYGCFDYDTQYQDINGPFGKVEFGYEYQNIDLSCFHLSSMSSSKDAGMKLLCGASFRIK